MNAFALIFLALFCVTIFTSYIVIRRGLMRTQVAGSLCAVVSVTCLFAFGIADDLLIPHALITALLIGLLFTGAGVAMATFFRVNQPASLEAYLPEDRASIK